jgi:hypothetical protein
VPGGGGSAGFNSRFAQPTRHPSTGASGSTLDHARDRFGNVPKIVIANTSTEYWNRDASLVTTTPDGMADVAPALNVRVYAFMGAQHYVGRSRARLPFVNCVSTTDHYLAMRALLLALEGWVRGTQAPPASAYPTLSEGTLLSVDGYRAAFPLGIGISPPAQNWSRGSILGRALRSRGSRIGCRRWRGLRTRRGCRHPMPTAMIGAGCGWWRCRFPWALTRVREAAQRQVAAGFMLPDDVERAVTENVGLYDRVMGHAPDDRSCRYLFGS